MKDENGKFLCRLGGKLMQTGRLVDGYDGEQIMSFYKEEGVVRIWGDTDAKNNEVFLARYEGEFHSKMEKMMGNSYNFMSSIDCAG